MSDAQATSSPSRLLTAKDLARMLNLSKRQVFRLNSCGKIPAPLRIGSALRWFAQEIMDWLAAGAPDRKAWETMRGKKREEGR